ncbi:MAG TPA: M23 family metallopeptidase [Candidatus Aquilonibacter sp.]|nr:M23 family metallopeptidase [Candidatus Aquilonibacter sp.]
MLWVRVTFWTLFLAAAGTCVGISYHKRFQAENRLKTEATQAQAEAEDIQRTVILFKSHPVPAGLPFATILENFGIEGDRAARLIASVQPVFDLRHLRAGNELAIGRSVLGELREVRYRIDGDHLLSIAPSGDAFQSKIETISSQTETVAVACEIHDSLFQSVIDAGEKPELAMRIADIFAFDLDFYTDPRQGDTLRVVVEKKVLSDGEAVSYGRVLAAQYVNAGHSYEAILFHDDAGDPAYFQPNGQAMKRAFLHSPLKFAAPITSHFSLSRYHPILKVYRPHLGTDYGAPEGTPVQTIGDGRVVFAGRKGEDGNLVKIQHTNGYFTYYMHLSRILVHVGQHVAQGDRIGLVGMTGLATGPHLDFRIELHGQFLNFERLRLPTANPISKKDWAAFAAARDSALEQMPSTPAGGSAVAMNASH